MTPDRLYLLAVRHFDGGLSADEAAQLAAALRDDPAAREAFAAVQSQVLAVADLPAVHPPVPAARRTRRRGWAHLVLAGTAAALVLAVTLDVAWRWTRPDPRAPTEVGVVATVERTAGMVRTGEDGPPLGPGGLVRAGEAVSTVGPASAAALRRTGGGPLFLGGDTTVVWSGPDGDRVVMSRGNLAVEVSRPPAARPFEVATPEARIETRESKLLVSCDRGRTQVRVLGGTARVEDATTHSTAAMGAGDWAEAAGGEVRVAQRTADVPDTADFRLAKGLPAGWQAGDATPDGVRAVPVAGAGGLRYRIVSVDDWTGGRFALADDTWVSVRLRVDRPGPVRVVLGVRPRDVSHLTGIVLEAPPIDAVAGAWQTAHVAYRDLRPARGFNGPADHTGVVCAIAVETDAADLGLVVERVWITRGPGPGPAPEEK